MNLTDTELNIEICKWRGWKKVDVYKWSQEGNAPATRDPLQYHGTDDLPNHITGPEALGNMALVEAVLTDHQYECYRIDLWDLVTGYEKPRHNESAPTQFERAYLSAAARQRAIAFLRVVKPELFK